MCEEIHCKIDMGACTIALYASGQEDWAALVGVVSKQRSTEERTKARGLQVVSSLCIRSLFPCFLSVFTVPSLFSRPSHKADELMKRLVLFAFMGSSFACLTAFIGSVHAFCCITLFVPFFHPAAAFNYLSSAYRPQ